MSTGHRTDTISEILGTVGVFAGTIGEILGTIGKGEPDLRRPTERMRGCRGVSGEPEAPPTRRSVLPEGGRVGGLAGGCGGRLRRGAGEARGDLGLRDAVDLDEVRAGSHVRIGRGLTEVENG